MSWKDVGNRVVDKSVEHYNYFWTVISTLVLNLIKLKLFYNFETQHCFCQDVIILVNFQRAYVGGRLKGEIYLENCYDNAHK